MNVTLKNTDSVGATISIEIAKGDYESTVEKSLKDLRRNAEIPGFRKGMVPHSFFKQKYGKSILVEEINKLVSQSLSDYIKDNDLQLLGEPLPAEDYEAVDFDNQEDFIFTFEIGLSPKIDVKLTKEDKMTYFAIHVSEEMIDKQIDHLKKRHGSTVFTEVIDETDVVKGNIKELNENGEPKSDGIAHENEVLMPQFMKDEDEKKKLINAKLNSTIIFNPFKAFDGNEAELSSLLKIKKEDVPNHSGDFSFEIKEIKHFKEAELNQELFNDVFGEGTVDSEESFRKKIKEDLVLQLAPESDYKFLLDARKLLEEKANDMILPDSFLKRWLLASDKNKTKESVEEEYPKFIKDLKFHLIKEHLIEANEITIEDNDLQEYARRMTRAQFAQYGMSNIPDDLLEKYSQEMLKKKESYRALGDKIFEDKLIKILKEQVTLKTKKIPVDKFNELLKED